MTRRMVILTEGYTNPHTAKTAACLCRYCPTEVVAILDRTLAGRMAGEFLGAGERTPIIARLDEASDANTLVIGIAPPGGRIPPEWRTVILAALDRGWNLLSGLHDFLSDDAEFASLAHRRRCTITDVRKNDEREIARRRGIRADCLRIHTVGHDCSVGKMVAAVELTSALRARGHDTHFVATGQTGIMVSGGGLPLDCITADFVAGAAEKLVLANQHHEILLIEGQGSIAHPSYSGVTLSLLHGCQPHGLVMVYEIGRTTITGIEGFPIPPLGTLIPLYESLAGLMNPCRVIGIALNTRRVGPVEAAAERARLREEFGLPVCDVLRDGCDELVDAILARRAELVSSLAGSISMAPPSDL